MSSSSELLASGVAVVPGGRAGARGRARPARPATDRWEQSFELAPGRPTPLADRGARHLQYSLAATLRPSVRDLLAAADGPLEALVLDCGEGYLAHCLLEWGLGSVLAIDARPEALRRAERIRTLAAIDPAVLRIAGGADLEPGLDRPRFDIAVADGRPGRLGAEAATLKLLARRSRLCALIAPDLPAGAAALRAAGFGKPSLAEPPADAERRLVAYELNLLLARPEAEDGSGAEIEPEISGDVPG